MQETFIVSSASATSLLLVILYLAYMGPNRLYKQELEIVSATLKKTVRETVRHDRGNVEAWLLIINMVRNIPTSSADFTISYLIVKLENDLIYKRDKKDIYHYKYTLSKTLRLVKELRLAFELDISKNPNISRIAIPKSVVIKMIKSAIKESS